MTESKRLHLQFVSIWCSDEKHYSSAVRTHHNNYLPLWVYLLVCAVKWSKSSVREETFQYSTEHELCMKTWVLLRVLFHHSLFCLVSLFFLICTEVCLCVRRINRSAHLHDVWTNKTTSVDVNALQWGETSGFSHEIWWSRNMMLWPPAQLII